MTAISLGGVQRAALTALAESGDGLTIAALTAALGRPPKDRASVDQAVQGLWRKGCARVYRYERRRGPATAVWGPSSTGLAVLESSSEGVAP